MSRGSFITFEGLDGAGKSTQIDLAARLLERTGKEIIRTREPGGTPLGEKLRTILLAERMTRETEAMLMFAARCEHLETLIRPALMRGAIVLCDRFTDASFAYQGGGRGVPVERLAALEDWVQQGLDPDLTLLFDLPFEIARQRLSGAGREIDRFESEAEEFHNRVREAYLKRARESLGRIQVIDSRQSLGEIEKQVEKAVLKLC